MSDILDRLRTVLTAFDDDALAALANKGLVRRARKDLEAAKPSILAPQQGALRLQVEDCTVDLAIMPGQSKCSCPASGICRHILVGLLFVRESALAAPANVEEKKPQPRTAQPGF